jgi:hypothetical protein
MRLPIAVAAVLLLTTACGQVDQASPLKVTATSTSASAPTSAPVPYAELMAPPPAAAPRFPCDITNGACVRLSTKESWLLTDGKVTYGPVPIMHGQAGFETPVGTFSVLYKVKDDWSVPYNMPMSYSSYFTSDGIAFHEGSLGEQSHGCVHLSAEAAPVYFAALTPGAQVQVVG